MPLLVSDPAEMADITLGTWHGIQLCRPLTSFQVRISESEFQQPGTVYAMMERSDQREPAPARQRLLTAFEAGAAAVIAPRDGDYTGVDRPILVVDDVKVAIKRLAIAARAKCRGKCVLVTGSVGKTGFKCLLSHVLATSFHVNFRRSSRNYHEVYPNLASMRTEDDVIVIEVSVPAPHYGSGRSKMIRPHLCVITEVGFEHMSVHKTLETLVQAKAGVVEGLEEGGVCVLNGDSGNFEALRRAVLARRQVPIAVYGSGEGCDGRVLCAGFEDDGWRVTSAIDGREVSFSVPMFGEHVPAAATGVLLAASRLGADLTRAAEAVSSYRPFSTQGVMRRLEVAGGHVHFFDNSRRGTLLSFRSVLADMRRLGANGGRKIAVIGEMRNLGEMLEAASREVATLLGAAGFDQIFLVGAGARHIFNHLPEPEKVAAWYPRYESDDADIDQRVAVIAAGLWAELAAGDLLLIKGELDELGYAMRLRRDKSAKARHPHPQPAGERQR